MIRGSMSFATDTTPEEWAAVLAEAAPNDAATCEGKLARSLEVALSFCKDPALSGLPYVPFLAQHSVNKEERVFRVDDGLFIASEHGAADVGLLRAFVTATLLP